MKRKVYLLAVLAALNVPASGLAGEKTQEVTPVLTMEEVVVTATRSAEPVNEIPSNITVITAEDISSSGATSIVEVLEKKANLHMRTFSGNPSQAKIDLRGSGGDNPFGKILVLLDGRRLNRLDMASVNWVQIPLQNIEKIEVVRGANSVMYGDAAVAGVIQIITRKGAVEPQPDFSLVFGENSYHEERVGVAGATGKLSYSVSGENHSTDGWRGRSGFNSAGGGFNLSYDFTTALSVSGGVSYNRTEFEMPGSLTVAEMDQDRAQYQPARAWTVAHDSDDSLNEYFNANLLVEGAAGESGSYEIGLVYGSKDITSNMPSGWDPGKFNLIRIDTFGITPKYVHEAVLAGLGHKLISGVDFYHELHTLDQYSDLARQAELYHTDLKRDSLGWYIRDEMTISESLKFGIGFRTEYARVEGKRTDSGTGALMFDAAKTFDERAFGVDLNWKPQDRLRLYTRFSTLYRYPFLDEQAEYQGNTGAFLTDLEAEKGKSYELGGDFSFTDNFKLGLTLYRTDLEDEIVYEGIFPNGRNRNVDASKHSGVEFSMAWEIDKLVSITGNYAYQNATFEKGQYKGREIPLVPLHTAAVAVSLNLPYGFYLSPEMRFVSDSYLGSDFDNSTDKLKGYLVYDFYVRYRPATARGRHSAFLGVKNIFDAEYSTDGTDGMGWSDNVYYPSPGRELTGGITIAF